MKYLSCEAYIEVAYDPTEDKQRVWEESYQKYQEAFAAVRPYLPKDFLRFYDETQLHDVILRNIEISLDNPLHPMITIVWEHAATKKDFSLIYQDVVSFDCSHIDFLDDEMTTYLIGEILLSNGVFSHEFLLSNEIAFEIKCKQITCAGEFDSVGSTTY